MLNASDPNYDFYLTIIVDKAYWSSLAAAGFILASIIIIANSALLFTTYKDPQKSLRKLPAVLLITNLSLSDLLLGSLNVFLVALRDVFRSRLEHIPHIVVFKSIVYTVLSTTLFVSSYSIIAMSIACYVAINSPVDYKSIITKGRLKVFIAVLWFASIAMCSLPLTRLSEETYTLIYLHTHVSLPAVFLTFIYANVFLSLASQTRELQTGRYDSVARYSLERERRMAITIAIILALFYITYIPQYVTLHLLYFCNRCQQSVTFHKIDVASSRFLYINSAINPFIYAWRVSQYRRAFLQVWQSFFGTSGATSQSSSSLNSTQRRTAFSAHSPGIGRPLYGKAKADCERCGTTSVWNAKRATFSNHLLMTDFRMELIYSKKFPFFPALF